MLCYVCMYVKYVMLCMLCMLCMICMDGWMEYVGMYVNEKIYIAYATHIVGFCP